MIASLCFCSFFLLAHMHVHPGVFRIFKLIALILLIAHATACVWLAIPAITGTEGDKSWKTESVFNFSDESETSLYTIAIYWAMSTLTTVGYVFRSFFFCF